eukprot:CAMPEP_0115483026 /NCGR_PEP_ID=MMETSP0271-20121206/58640_1 /TAXON_ID=71861 /ORGANISM="Scrippsiella trochoidea, Strain CCMP3099" /LENGTH=117 /DNA_ID=CAMNT_0002910857 /DNA_START=254 /DNA_END=605 /DNA_ORIENTATION=-
MRSMSINFFAWIDVGSKSGRKQDATMASASGLGLACLMSNLCWSLRGRLCAVSKCFKAWDHSYLGNNCNMADCRPAVSLLPALLTKSLQGQLSMHGGLAPSEGEPLQPASIPAQVAD